jgi:hypothetical protein
MMVHRFVCHFSSPFLLALWLLREAVGRSGNPISRSQDGFISAILPLLHLLYPVDLDISLPSLFAKVFAGWTRSLVRSLTFIGIVRDMRRGKL